MPNHISMDRDKIAEFCRRNHIRRLSLFGSVLRNDFRPDSDVDVLVEFEPDHIPGLLRLARMEGELTRLIGREVDMRTPADLSPYFRDDVLAEAEEQYAPSIIGCAGQDDAGDPREPVGEALVAVEHGGGIAPEADGNPCTVRKAGIPRACTAHHGDEPLSYGYCRGVTEVFSDNE